MIERIWDLYFLKQVYGLHKEEIEKVVHRIQKLDTKDPKEKYVCVWSYVYDFFFYSLGRFVSFSLLKASCLLFRHLGSARNRTPLLVWEVVSLITQCNPSSHCTVKRKVQNVELRFQWLTYCATGMRCMAALWKQIWHCAVARAISYSSPKTVLLTWKWEMICPPKPARWMFQPQSYNIQLLLGETSVWCAGADFHIYSGVSLGQNRLQIEQFRAEKSLPSPVFWVSWPGKNPVWEYVL